MVALTVSEVETETETEVEIEIEVEIEVEIESVTEDEPELLDEVEDPCADVTVGDSCAQPEMSV